MIVADANQLIQTKFHGNTAEGTSADAVNYEQMIAQLKDEVQVRQCFCSVYNAVFGEVSYSRGIGGMPATKSSLSTSRHQSKKF